MVGSNNESCGGFQLAVQLRTRYLGLNTKGEINESLRSDVGQTLQGAV
jgi:hypothetical protein